MPIKHNSLPNRSKDKYFGIESEHFASSHFNEVSKFIEDNHGYFYPSEDPDNYRFDVGNEHEVVEDVDAQSLIKLVKFLKRGKAPGPNTIRNQVLRPDSTTTSLLHQFEIRIFRLRQEKHIWSYAKNYSKATEPYLPK